MDLSSTLSEDLASALERALLEHQVLLLRDQTLDAHQLVRVGTALGTPRRARQNVHVPSPDPCAHYMTNLDARGEPTHVHPDPHAKYWHSDGSWSRTPARATLLHAVEVPESGGDTLFADMYGLCESLPPETRAEWSEYCAVHHVDLSRAAREGRWPWQWWREAEVPTSPGENLRWLARLGFVLLRDGWATHPLIRRHPETGRGTLFIGDHAWRIAGMPWGRGIRRMRAINAMEFAPRHVIRHRWRRGDLLVWDNASILHRASDFDLSQPRLMCRCVVLGEPGKRPSR